MTGGTGDPTGTDRPDEALRCASGRKVASGAGRAHGGHRRCGQYGPVGRRRTAPPEHRVGLLPRRLGRQPAHVARRHGVAGLRAGQRGRAAGGVRRGHRAAAVLRRRLRGDQPTGHQHRRVLHVRRPRHRPPAGDRRRAARDRRVHGQRGRDRRQRRLLHEDHRGRARLRHRLGLGQRRRAGAGRVRSATGRCTSAPRCSARSWWSAWSVLLTYDVLVIAAQGSGGALPARVVLARHGALRLAVHGLHLRHHLLRRHRDGRALQRGDRPTPSGRCPGPSTSRWPAWASSTC